MPKNTFVPAVANRVIYSVGVFDEEDKRFVFIGPYGDQGDSTDAIWIEEIPVPYTQEDVEQEEEYLRALDQMCNDLPLNKIPYFSGGD